MNREYRDGPREPRREEHRDDRPGGPRRPEGPRRHEVRKPERPFIPERPDRPERPERPRRPRRPRYKQVTKMFTSKEELVEYVNVEGEKGHSIDVFKIEDSLYKVVKVDRPQPEEPEAE